MESDSHILNARILLGRHRQGELRFGDRASTLRFVIDPASGCLIAPLEPGAAEHVDHVLHLPDETDPVLSAQLTPTPLEDDLEAMALRDRWLMYHLKAAHRHWSRLMIDAVKFGEWVVDGEALKSRDALRDVEGPLLRRLNADQARLSAACRAATRVTIEEPVAVGLDSLGIDVRARFGIVRVEFPREAAEPTDVEAAIALLLSAGQRGDEGSQGP